MGMYIHVSVTGYFSFMSFNNKSAHGAKSKTSIERQHAKHAISFEMRVGYAVNYGSQVILASVVGVPFTYNAYNSGQSTDNFLDLPFQAVDINKNG
jgi:hypothetical protein